MVKKLFTKDRFLFFSLALLFVVFNGMLIEKEIFYAPLVPVVFVIIWLALKSLDKLIFFIIFFVPLSVPLSEFKEGLAIDMFMPTEPLLAGMLLLFIIMLPTGQMIDKKLLKHPVSIVIAIQLTWILITALTSTMPIVSLKFFLMRTWFVIAFFYLMVNAFRKYNDFYRLVWLYAIPMIIVIIYALTRHLTYGIFDKKIAHWSANPFFRDHTVYGAILAFFIPFLTMLAFRKNQPVLKKIGMLFLLFMFAAALMFSYSRAAWASLVAAFGVFLVIWFRVKLKYLITLFIIGLILVGSMWNSIMVQLEQNKQDSSVENLSDNVKSMTNISSDASNLERINRWMCAIRMFKDKPIFGFGPGTYLFQYAPFQRSYEKTIISTNAGNRGNAHSEYLGPLAESGILGLLTFLSLVITISIVALQLYFRLSDKKLKSIVLGAYLGLVTYFLHGFLNNFLDTDKASVPFWGFTAMIVAIDLYEKRFTTEKLEELETK